MTFFVAAATDSFAAAASVTIVQHHGAFAARRAAAMSGTFVHSHAAMMYVPIASRYRPQKESVKYVPTERHAASATTKKIERKTRRFC